MVNSAFDTHEWESEEFHALRHSQGSFLLSPPNSPVTPTGAETCVPIVVSEVHVLVGRADQEPQTSTRTY